jgi:hypothetical protein
MRSLPAHAALLAEALLGIGGQNIALLNVTRYLGMAAGIRRVEFSTFDIGFSSDGQQEKLSELIVHRWTVFQFTWLGVRGYGELAELPGTSNAETQPAMDALCDYLTRQYVLPLPEGYVQLLADFKRAAVDSKREELAAPVPARVQPPAEGLYLADRVYRAMADGDFPLPWWKKGAADEDPHVKLLELATRLVLLTMQMLALCRYSLEERVDIPSLGVDEDSEHRLTVREAFSDLHLQAFEASGKLNN